MWEARWINPRGASIEVALLERAKAIHPDKSAEIVLSEDTSRFRKSA